MTKLLDSFMEHRPVSPVGTTIKPDQLKAVQEEIKTLRTQLAKASEETLKLEQRLKSTEELLISSNDDLAKANERVAKLECENTNGNAAAELLIWWAQRLSNAPNEDLKEVVRIGYKRIVNLANLIGEEQLHKGQE